MSTQSESNNRLKTAQSPDSREMAAVQRRIWAGRIFGVAVAFAGLIVILAQQAHTPVNYGLDAFILVVITTIALVPAEENVLNPEVSQS